MTELLKSVVKSFLQTGDIPTETNFSDWVDSQVFVTPNEDGSVAIGYNAVVTGKQSLQVGHGTNNIDDSIKVGGSLTGPGITLLGSEPLDPDSASNGQMWINSFGYFCFKSGGKVIKLKQG